MSLKKNWSVKEILTWILKKFSEANIQSPLLDAQLLMCHALKFKNRIDLYLQSEKIPNEDELDILRDLLKRRLLREPVAYIINQKYWYNLDLYIDQNVLIPRCETESLLDFMLDSLNESQIKPEIIFDFCTGSGCMGIALGKIFPKAKIFAFDISTSSLEVAKTNALRNQVANIEFIPLDLSNELSYEFLRANFPKADMITANPPYISLNDWSCLLAEIKSHEPKISLVSEDDGLFLGQKIFNGVIQFDLLNSKSIFGMELDHGQPEKILANQKKKNISFLNAHHWEKPIGEWFIVKDLENKERFLFKIEGVKS